MGCVNYTYNWKNWGAGVWLGWSRKRNVSGRRCIGEWELVPVFAITISIQKVN